MANHILQLPAGLRQLKTQVAGHTFEETNGASVGMLQDDETGCVLKPLGKPDCRERELWFYEALRKAKHENGDSILSDIYPFVPKFYKSLKLIVNNCEHIFVKLENLTHGMSKPCIMDLKVGKRTWDPLATKEKQQVEEQKYVQCKQILGICVPGFQVYIPTNNTNDNDTEQTILIRHGKEYGKSLDVNGFRKTLELFFNFDRNNPEYNTASMMLIHEILKQLYYIRLWFSRQNILHFYASSLLITYDFVQLQKIKAKIKISNGINIKIPNDANELPWIKVRMIDFAHVFAAENGQFDNNYLYGLEHLITILEKLLRA